MNKSTKETDEDIQTDAIMEPDEGQVLSTPQVLSCIVPSNRSQSSKPAIPELDKPTLPRHLVYAQSARPIESFDDKEHLQYLYHMPSHLQEDNCEILIINSDNDIKAAMIFQNHLKKEILFRIHNQLRAPRVKLLREIMHEGINNLDIVFPKALYVFLYVTQHFCEQYETLLLGQACLAEAINDPLKKWCIVPIHTASKKNQRYKLPMMLNCLRSIHYWSGSQDQFYVDSIRKLLESKAGEVLERDNKLDDSRRDCFKKNRVKWVALANDFKRSTSLPVLCSSDANGDPSKVSSQESSDTASSLSDSGVCTYHSLPDKQNKAFPEEGLSDLAEQVEEMTVSEESYLVQNTSQEGDSQGILQQSLSSSVRIRCHGAQRSQLEATTASSNINNNSDSNNQSVPEVPISSTIEPYSSIVVDGPANDDDNLLLSPNPGFTDYQDRRSAGHPPPSSIPVGSYALGNITHNSHNGIPTFQHSPMNPAVYNLPNQGAFMLDNYGRPLYLQQPNYQMMQPQYYNPMYNPHLYQPMQQHHHHPSMLPYNMQQLYSYANPIPPDPYFYNTMRSYNPTSEPASYPASQQMSTEMNAPNSIKSNLSGNSFPGHFSAFGSLPGTGQWLPPDLSTLNSVPFPQSANRNPASTRPQGQTFPTIPQQTQSRSPATNERESPQEPQLGVVGTVSGSNAPPTVNSAGTILAANLETANPVIQHIHHHHHEKKIKVSGATNVLIGDKSTFVNKHRSSDLAANDEDSSDDDSTPLDDENSNQNLDRLKGSSSSTSRRNLPCAVAEPNVPDAPGSGSAANDNPNMEAPIGFAECLSPVSITRRPVEGSDTSFRSVVEDVSPTDCKQVY